MEDVRVMSPDLPPGDPVWPVVSRELGLWDPHAFWTEAASVPDVECSEF